jgi:Ca2+-binding RTX toxin-like protein
LANTPKFVRGTVGNDVFTATSTGPNSGNYVLNASPSVSFSGVSYVDFYGDKGNDRINGWAGVDSLSGGAGNDTIDGRAGNDTLEGHSGVDTLHGGQGDDELWVGYFDDEKGEIYDGGAGTDILVAGTSDVSIGYFIDLSDDTLISIEVLAYIPPGWLAQPAGASVYLDASQFGAGFSLTGKVFGTGTELGDYLGVTMGTETKLDLSRLIFKYFDAPEDAVSIKGDADAEQIVGTSVRDSIEGGAGNDVLDGRGGNDALDGGAGNDTFHVSQKGDIVIEGAGRGFDTVRSTVTYVLGANAEIEVLQTEKTLGTGAINLTGNRFVQIVIGNNGANIIDGKGGADRMEGRAGNDTFYVDSGADIVVEGDKGGIDTVLTSVSYRLGGAARVETLATTNISGTTAISLTGNTFNDAIVGNAGNNVINGAAGNDRLDGQGGNDSLNGSLGNDKILGHAGNDSFVFNSALNAATNVDTIYDFSNVAGDNDTIRLENAIFTQLTVTGVLAASRFKANGSGVATDADDRIVYSTVTGDLFYDTNGNAAGGATRFAHLENHASLTSADFLVV